MSVSRRDWLRTLLLAGAGALIPAPVAKAYAARTADADHERLRLWSYWQGIETRRGGWEMPRRTARVGEYALGTPYQAFTLEAYLRRGGHPGREPLALSLTRFDCVTFVESSLAIARLVATGGRGWSGFAREVERLRYRGGVRDGYLSRLHYFSEWISDNQRRGHVRDLGRELGGVADRRPLRFMTQHPESYPALAWDQTRREIGQLERRLDGHPRWVIPSDRIPEVEDFIESGDILAYATSLAGLDVTHTGLAWRGPDGVVRVLHAPLSGGVVEITRATLHGYVRGLGTASGILVARPVL
ncbi:MAG: N-acetylmuramoyl-L-alanine amidase-like domain-containing protein [Longimicrobiaceae bacterium]